MKITDNVFMLELTKSKGGEIYPTLVYDGNTLVLVDTGYPLEVDLLEAEIKRAGFALEDVDLVILTHQDIDHVGCVKEVVNRSGALVFAYEDEIPYINGEKTPTKVEEMGKRFDSMTKEGQMWYLNLKKGFENRRADVDRALFDREVLDVLDGLEIIHSPGHTPGHIFVYVKGSKILIAGDGMNINEGKLVGADPEYSQDIELANASIKKIADYDVDYVITYHCGMFKVDGKISI